MATQWLLVRNRLVEVLPSLPGWPGPEHTYKGRPVTGDNPRSYVTVGYVSNEDNGGTVSQARSRNGFQQEESGTVRGELVLNHGTADSSELEATTFALLDSLEELLRAQTAPLGVLPQGSTVALSFDVQPVQNSSGAAVRVPFTIDYFVTT